MRHICEILHLHHLKISSRQIGISCKISKTTVNKTLKLLGTDFNANQDFARALALQPNSKIVVVVSSN